jgi:hypothetical protein
MRKALTRFHAGLALRRTVENRILTFRDGRQTGITRAGENVERVIGRALTPAERRIWDRRGIWSPRIAKA